MNSKRDVPKDAEETIVVPHGNIVCADGIEETDAEQLRECLRVVRESRLYKPKAQREWGRQIGELPRQNGGEEPPEEQAA